MRPGSLSRVVLFASLGATACGFGVGLGDGKRRRQCDALVERVAETTLPAAPPGLALNFAAEQLHVDKWHPHSGPVCYYAGLVPRGWTPVVPDATEAGERWSAPDGGATLSYTLLSAGGPREKWIADHEVAPALARGQVKRETFAVLSDAGQRRHVLVTREGETLRLRVIRWSTRDDGHFYFRCDASLAPAYAPVLPLFEAVCDAARVRHFDYPPW